MQKIDNTWLQRRTELAVAFALLSRLPLPKLSADAFSQAARAVWAYGIIGLILSLLSVCCGLILLHWGAPEVVAAGFAVMVGLLASGALHEDGLADVVDGFWGGHTRSRRLEIMRDSQIGSYGTLALILVFGLRWQLFATLLAAAPLAIVAAAVVSRAAMGGVMCALPHARRDGLSQLVGRPALGTASVGAGLSALMVLLCVGFGKMLGVLIIVGLVGIFCGLLAKRKIGGQTGDVLGATQQISELGALLALVLWV